MSRYLRAAAVLLTGILFFSVVPGAFAQQAPQTVLSLRQCIDIALENNTALKNSAYMKKAAEMGELSSYRGILPTMSVTAGRGKVETGPSEYLSNEPVAIDEQTGNVIYEQRTRAIPKSTRKSTSAGLNVNQMIFDGGIWWNQIRKARADLSAAEYSYLDERDNTILQVQQAYFDVIKQIKMLEVYDVAVQRSQAQLDRSKKMYELGAIAHLDVYRAKVNLGNDRINYLNQKNTVQQSKKNLNLVMGRDPFTPIGVEIDTELEHSLPPIDEMVQTALANQPLVKKTKMDIRSRELSLSMAKGMNFPKISAYLNYNRFHENAVKVFSEFDKNYQTQYGINLSFNIFNGFSDYTNVQKAEINYKSALENFENYKRKLKSTIHQYYETYQSTLDIIKINKQNLEAAKEELRLAEERYQVGAVTSLDVRDSQVNLTRAEETLIAAQFAARLILAQLDYQLGITSKKL